MPTFLLMFPQFLITMFCQTKAAFMNLEKAYDRIDKEAVWNMLKVCGMGRRLLDEMKKHFTGMPVHIIKVKGKVGVNVSK